MKVSEIYLTQEEMIAHIIGLNHTIKSAYPKLGVYTPLLQSYNI